MFTFFPLLKSKQKISKPARLITDIQDMSSVTGTFEEFCSKFPEHLFEEHISVAVSSNYITVSALSFRGTPRLWNAFESVSFTLGTKSVLKINYDVRIHSGKKLKKHKVQNWINTGIFKHYFR